MANTSDSLRINDSYRACSESGQENTEGALVSTISQADENSKPLIQNKGVPCTSERGKWRLPSQPSQTKLRDSGL